FDIHSRTQRRLMNARVIDLHVDADRLAAMEDAGEVRDHFVLPDGEHAGQLIAETLQFGCEHERRGRKLFRIVLRHGEAETLDLLRAGVRSEEHTSELQSQSNL